VENISPFNGNRPTSRVLESEKTESASAEETPIDTLSHRQQEILKMIAEDLTSREIGDRLGVSTKTVEFHRINIKERLGVKGVAGMVRYAIRTGLLEP
jgi:DNA-binding CsgD family transcriptional regulator